MIYLLFLLNFMSLHFADSNRPGPCIRLPIRTNDSYTGLSGRLIVSADVSVLSQFNTLSGTPIFYEICILMMNSHLDDT